jgi:hypothetical protein
MTLSKNSRNLWETILLPAINKDKIIKIRSKKVSNNQEKNHSKFLEESKSFRSAKKDPNLKFTIKKTLGNSNLNLTIIYSIKMKPKTCRIKFLI